METIMNTPELLITIAIGLAVLLFGYRLKRVAFFIIWFLLGYYLTNNFLMGPINSAVPAVAASSLYQILLPIAGGLLLALMGFSIEKLCVAGITFILVMMVTMQYFGTDIPTLAVGAIIGVVLGAFAVRMIKPATVIATSLAGAYALTLCAFTLFPGIDKATFYWIILIGLAAFGALFQFGTTKDIF